MNTSLCSLLLLTALAPQEPAGGKPTPLVELIAALQHDSPARREGATRSLIAAGYRALALVRPLCTVADPALAQRARHIFGAVTGTAPETAHAVDRLLAQNREGRLTVAEAAALIRAAGPGADTYALDTLAPKTGNDSTPLGAELLVHQLLPVVAEGRDKDEAARRQLAALGARGADALLRAASDPHRTTGARLHALWLFAEGAPAGRTAALAPLLADPDAALRSEAMALAVEAVRAEDFNPVADAMGTGASPARQPLARAFARVIDVDGLKGPLRGAPARAMLAARTLGLLRTDGARKELVTELQRGLDQGSESWEELVESAPSPDPAELMTHFEGSVAPLPDAAKTEALVAALGEIGGEDAFAALVDAFTRSRAPPVRAACLRALRTAGAGQHAQTCLLAGLFDPSQVVRQQAADTLATLDEQHFAPALILAAESDESLRTRALAALPLLVPADETAGASGPPARSASWDGWRRWLSRRGPDLHGDQLPWYRGSLEAVRIVQGVRKRIRSSFFHFGKTELIEEEHLAQAARESMNALLLHPKDKSGLLCEGVERLLLERIVHSKQMKDADQVLAALGSLPLSSAPADLVRLTDAAVQGMVKSLDDRYSRVRPSNDPEGKVRPGWLPGLLDDPKGTNGLYLEEKDGAHHIAFVLFDTPAWYADLRVGDQVLRLGDDLPVDLEKEDLEKRVHQAGDFLVLRDGWSRPRTYHLEPTQPDPERLVTSTMLPGGIGYLRLKMFDIGSSSRIEKALVALEQQEPKGLILDLRNNPGGTLIDATNIVDLFLPEGELICVKETRTGADDPDDTKKDEIRSTAKGADRDLPLVILVNESSASASEMTSGSLQGNGRAVIVGRRSFGKGIGQNGVNLPGFSSDTALGRTRSVYQVYLTMMRYYLPEDERSIHGIGVEPDVPVHQRSLRGNRFSKAVRVLDHSAFLEYVDDLLEDHRELAVELARFDGEEEDRYPEFAALAAKMARWVDGDDLRSLVRKQLRRGLLPTADAATFRALLCDLQEDRTLRAAIGHLAAEVGIELGEHEEYRGIR